MMIKKIDSLKNNYYVIGTFCLNDGKYGQYNKEVIDYIIKNKTYVGKDCDFIVYK